MNTSQRRNRKLLKAFRQSQMLRTRTIQHRTQSLDEQTIRTASANSIRFRRTSQQSQSSEDDRDRRNSTDEVEVPVPPTPIIRRTSSQTLRFNVIAQEQLHVNEGRRQGRDVNRYSSDGPPEFRGERRGESPNTRRRLSDITHHREHPRYQDSDDSDFEPHDDPPEYAYTSRFNRSDRHGGQSFRSRQRRQSQQDRRSST